MFWQIIVATFAGGVLMFMGFIVGAAAERGARAREREGDRG